MKRPKTLQFIEQKARRVKQFSLLILPQRFNFKHMYIPFILKLFNYIQNNDELWFFKILWIRY